MEIETKLFFENFMKHWKIAHYFACSDKITNNGYLIYKILIFLLLTLRDKRYGPFHLNGIFSYANEGHN